jgi:hypothetical protein
MQLGLFALAWLLIHVKTVQLLPVAISGKPVVWVGLERRSGMKFPEFRSEYR